MSVFLPMAAKATKQQHVQFVFLLTLAGCAWATTIVDLTDSERSCCLHGDALQFETVPAFHGRVTRKSRFRLEDYCRFPFANDKRVIALGDDDYKHLEAARISFCSECRRSKDAELKVLKGRRKQDRQEELNATDSIPHHEATR